MMTEEAKTANRMYSKISTAIKMRLSLGEVIRLIFCFYISNMFQRHTNHNQNKYLKGSLIVFHLLSNTFYVNGCNIYSIFEL